MGQPAVPILATCSYSGRTAAGLSNSYEVNVAGAIEVNGSIAAGSLSDQLDGASALRFCLPQSEDTLMNGTASCLDYYKWIHNISFDMENGADIPSEGTVAAPTVTTRLSEDENTLYVSFACTTEGASIYYTSNIAMPYDNTPQYLYDGTELSFDVSGRNLTERPVYFWATAVKEGWDDMGQTSISTTPVSSTFPFTDVDSAHWARSDIEYVYSNGLMTGMTSTLFGPEVEMNRAMLVTILHRTQGEPAAEKKTAFSDVAATSDYYDAVMWATEQGIADGVGGGLFQPEGIVTREQACDMLYCFVSAIYTGNWSLTEQGSLSSYADAEAVSSWAEDGMKWAVGAGIISGTSAVRLEPGGSVTRAQMARMLATLFQYVLPGTAEGHTVSIKLYGSGSATVLGRTIHGNASGVVRVGEQESASIALQAQEDAFISYYVVDDGSEEEEYTYLGYQMQASTIPFSAVGSDIAIRVYFVENGTDEYLVNGSSDTTSLTGNHNYGDTYTYDFITTLLGKDKTDRIYEKFEMDIGEDYVVGGHCYGLCIATAMVGQPWKSGITAAGFSDYRSYTVPSDVQPEESSAAADGLSMRDMITVLHLAQEIKNLMHNCNNDANWVEFFDAVEAYQTDHTNPVVLSISGAGYAAHALFVTGYSVEADGTVTIQVHDPNGDEASVQITKTGTGSDPADWANIQANYQALGKEYYQFYYLTLDDMMTLWELREINQTTAATADSSLLVYIGMENESIDSLVLTASNGDTATLTNGGMDTEIENARVFDFLPADHSADGSFFLLPEDTYTITNTKDSVLTVSLADDFASVDVEIQPNVTAVITVSDTDVSACQVVLEAEEGTDFSAEFSFDKQLATEFQSLQLSGSMEAGGADIQMGDDGLTVTGVTAADVRQVNFDGLTILTEGLTAANAGIASAEVSVPTDIIFIDADAGAKTGNAAVQDNGAVAVTTMIDPEYEQLTQPEGLSFTDGIIRWDEVDGAREYRLILYRDGAASMLPAYTTDCEYSFAARMTNPESTYTITRRFQPRQSPPEHRQYMHKQVMGAVAS